MGATALLLALLIFIRLLDSERTPDRLVRQVETIDEVAVPAPPPPPPPVEETPPPPPPLPQLDLQLDNIAPPIKAVIDQKIDFTMITPEFNTELDVPPPPPEIPKVTPPPNPRPTPPRPIAKSSYDLGELDSKPRLLNSPSVSFPSSLRRRGVRRGTVTLNVSIDTTGRVTVNSVIKSSHPELVRMAKSYATRARYTVPKKDGKPVKATFTWPLTLSQ